MDHINNERSRILQNVAATFSMPVDADLIKSEIDEFEKGAAGGGAPIGTIKMFGNREHIKTAQGWKYHGKGGGKLAQTHVGQAVGNGHKIQVDHANAFSQPTVSEGHLHQTAKEEKSAAEAATEKIAAEKMGDINFRFKMFSTAIKAVISGKFKSCIGYGTGGVGKTYTVTGQLAAAGKVAFDDEEMTPGGDDYDFVKITGKMTAPQVYKAMYQHNGKILLFDDCDSVLTDSASVNLFKGALDSSGDGTIQYATSSGVKMEDADGETVKVPNRFKFNGRAIFVSNLAPHVLPQPIKSRAVRVDLTMDKQQTMDRIREIAKNPKTGKYENLKFPGMDKYSHEDMEAVIGYLDKHKEHTTDLNVRTVGSILGMRQLAHEDGDGKNWEKYADQMFFSKSENFDYDGGLLKSRTQFIDQLYKSSVNNFKEIEKSEDVKSEVNVDEVEKSEQVEQLTKGETDQLSTAFADLIG